MKIIQHASSDPSFPWKRESSSPSVTPAEAGVQTIVEARELCGCQPRWHDARLDNDGVPIKLKEIPLPERFRSFLRWFLVVAYAVAGIAHLKSPGVLAPIMPDWVPYPREVILVTGVCEIAGAIALSTRRFRYLAGVMLAAYALCVWPANFKHAFGGVEIGNTQLGWWYHATRLSLQPIIIWAALFAGRVVDWPFGNQTKLSGEE